MTQQSIFGSLPHSCLVWAQLVVVASSHQREREREREKKKERGRERREPLHILQHLAETYPREVLFFRDVTFAAFEPAPDPSRVMLFGGGFL